MKISITGHTSGIGKCLFDIYIKNNHTVSGYSLSSGYDVNNDSIRKSIIESSKDSDVFINNAYADPGQTLLLKEIAKEWQGQNKRIVNISSKLSFLPKGKLPMLDTYIEQKTQQNEFIRSQFTKAYPKITNIIVGLVDTPMSKTFESIKINPVELGNFIYQISLSNSLNIQQVVIDVPGLDWEDIRNNK